MLVHITAMGLCAYNGDGFFWAPLFEGVAGLSQVWVLNWSWSFLDSVFWKAQKSS